MAAEDHGLLSLRTAGDVAAAAERIYGDALEAKGIVQVVACWRPSAETLAVIKIGPGSPRALHDVFALGLARARADAILSTGQILRSEPEVRHELPGPPELAGALAAFRRERLGKTAPPIPLVLTSGRDVDLDHPLFTAAPQTILFTSEDGAARLDEQARARGITVVAHPEPGARSALDYLRRERDVRTLVVEAGPTTTRKLYDDPVAIDELMLSVFEEPRLDPAFVGGDFLAPAELARLLPASSRPFEVNAPSGHWSFERRRARRPLEAA